MAIHYAGLLPLIGGIVLVASLAYEAMRREKYSRMLFKLGTSLIALGWLVYIIPFLTLDYSLAEVSASASSDLSLPLRLAASWSGGGGSLYLYTALLSLIALYPAASSGDTRKYRVAVSMTLLALLASTALNGAFSSSDGLGGFGLNPLLKNYWVIPHPLTTFGGYALLLGGSLILLFTGDKGRGRAVFLAGWGLLSLGITFGALWSYETLGWGGYWAWDPVEVSELTVWLAATAYLHSLGPLSSIQPLTASLTGSAALLAPYVTRSGLSPLHSFAAANVGSLILLAGAIALLGYSIKTIVELRSPGYSFKTLHSSIRRSSPLMISITVAGASITAMAVYVYASLLAPSILSAMGVKASPPSMGEGIRFYHPILYPLILAAAAFLPGYALGQHLTTRALTGYLIIVAVSSITVAAAVYTGALTVLPGASLSTNLQAAVGVTVSLLASGALIVSLYVWARGSRVITGAAVRDLAVRLIHLSMIVALVGVLLSATYAYNESYFTTQRLTMNTPLQVGPYRVELIGYSFELYNGTIDLTHISGSFTEYAAWHGLILLHLDLGSVVSEVSQAKTTLEEDPNLSTLVGLASSKDSFNVTGAYGFNATGTIYFVDVRDPSKRELVAANESITLIIVNPRITVSLEPVYDDRGGLAGGNLTILVESERVECNAQVNWSKYPLNPHSYYELKLDEPVNMSIPNGWLNVWEAELYPALIGGNEANATLNWGSATFNSATLRVALGDLQYGGSSYRVPLNVSRGLLLYLLAERGDLPILRDVLNSSLSQVAVNESLIGSVTDMQPGQVALPTMVPSGAVLHLKLRVSSDSGESTMLNADVRFEANGEAMGIHGLVSPVILLRDGLSEYYVAVSPPYREGYFGYYHEPLLYYASNAMKVLPLDDALVTLAVMSAGYDISRLSQASTTDIGYEAEKSLVDVYMLAEKFNPADSSMLRDGLTVRVKYVPGVDLVWAGGVSMGVLGLAASLLYIVMIHRGSRVGDELIQV